MINELNLKKNEQISLPNHFHFEYQATIVAIANRPTTYCSKRKKSFALAKAKQTKFLLIKKKQKLTPKCPVTFSNTAS